MHFSPLKRKLFNIINREKYDDEGIKKKRKKNPPEKKTPETNKKLKFSNVEFR